MSSETTLQIFTKKEGALITFQGSTMVLSRSGGKKQQGKWILGNLLENNGNIGPDNRDLMTVLSHAGYQWLVPHPLHSLCWQFLLGIESHTTDHNCDCFANKSLDVLVPPSMDRIAIYCNILQCIAAQGQSQSSPNLGSLRSWYQATAYIPRHTEELRVTGLAWRVWRSPLLWPGSVQRFLCGLCAHNSFHYPLQKFSYFSCALQATV